MMGGPPSFLPFLGPTWNKAPVVVMEQQQKERAEWRSSEAVEATIDLDVRAGRKGGFNP